MQLADLSARKRHDTLWLALGFVLQDLTAPAATFDVCDRLCDRLETKERKLIGRWLTVKAAPLTPECRRSGATFQAFGRQHRRFIWSPRTHSNPGQVPVVEDWTVTREPATGEGKLTAAEVAALPRGNE